MLFRSNAGTSYNLYQITITAKYSNFRDSNVTNVTWTKKTGSGTLSGNFFSSPSNPETNVLICTYSEGGNTKTVELTITVFGQTGRFTRDANGVITDSQTNLQWLEGSNQAITWNNAQTWINSLGNGWRTPTLEELKGIYIADSTRKGGVSGSSGPYFLRLDPAFQLENAYYVWSTENGSASAWLFGFDSGTSSFSRSSNETWWTYRAFAVRP